ncbi:MAG: hypothetical protein ACREXT_14440, partial [Gammaproteobacteria bacterium]
MTIEPRLGALAFGAVVTAYVFGYLLWYSGTPLGHVPLLDEREILALATRIAAGNLPPESFYRAPLYSALLAVPLWLGVNPLALPLLARLFNGVCHLLSVWVVWRLAGVLWRRRAAQIFSATLVGFNPVLLHFCGDALDITTAITALVAGVAAALIAIRRAQRPGWWWSIASLAFGLGALLRPQLMPLLVALPVIGLMIGHPPHALRQIFAATVPGVLCLVIFGAINYALADEFRILPWQGAYNLWAANRPGAHGRYFEQRIPIHTNDPGANTARIESEILYRRQQPGASRSPQAMSDYWRDQALRVIAANPLAWLRLLTSKAFYLVNNVEQYNNKTFSFHQSRSPWLRHNPLNWTMVLSAGVVGLVLHWRRPESRLLTLLAAAYAAGVLLYFVSDRFRAPLIPLFAIGAGGVISLPATGRRWPALAAGAALAGLSLVPIPRAEQQRTYVQDELALARAHSELGEHAQALGWALRALERAPNRTSVLALACVTRFNAWLHAPSAIMPSDLAQWRGDCRAAAELSPTARRILGYLAWRAGALAESRALWVA